MAFLRMGVRAIVLLGLGAAWLPAQTKRVHVIEAPQGRPRIAMVAPPPPQPPPLTTYGQTVFATAPVIVTADGRVLVDIGNGYEQVARTCPYAYGYGCQSYGYPMAPQTPVPQSYVPTYVPPTYAPPAYGAPVYPTPMYPPATAYGAYGGYPVGAQPGYVPPGYPQPTYTPAQTYNGCPPHYVPTGGYPPCVDPARTPTTSAQLPPASTTRAAPRAAPRSPAATGTHAAAVRR